MRDVKPIPDGFHTITPYLIVDDGAAVIAFLERAFGARLLDRHDDDAGRLVHAELQLGDSRLMMGEANEQIPAMTAMLHLYVEDVDTVFSRAIAAGGRSLREPEDQFYGDRSGGLLDPAGNQWWLATHVEDVTPEEMERRQREQAKA